MATDYYKRVLFIVLVAAAQGCAAEERALRWLGLPSGFSANLYAEDVPDARSMALGDEGAR